jgi:hypothetical protein
VKVTLGSAALLGLVLASAVAAIFVVLGRKDVETTLTDDDTTYDQALDTAALGRRPGDALWRCGSRNH